jgi:hypothetical protein
MRALVSLLLLVVAVIHLLPLSGVLGSTQLTALYGTRFDDPAIALLMQHRAVLFGLLGVLLAVAAFRPALQTLAFTAGSVSVVSFLLLARLAHPALSANPSDPASEAIARIVVADWVAFSCLIIGMSARLYLRSRGGGIAR